MELEPEVSLGLKNSSGRFVMFMLLSASALAFTVETTCQEVKNIHAVGVPGASILESVEGTYITEETRICIAESELPVEVKDWALKAPPVPSEYINVPAPETIEEEPPAVDTVNSISTERRPRRLSGKAREREVYCQNLPDPGVAALLSFQVGYGSGHFYAGQVERGMRFAVVHAVANAIVLGGVGILYGGTNDGDVDQMELGRTVVITAAAATLVIHAIDAAMAPGSAREAWETCY